MNIKNLNETLEKINEQEEVSRPEIAAAVTHFVNTGNLEQLDNVCQYIMLDDIVEIIDGIEELNLEEEDFISKLTEAIYYAEESHRGSKDMQVHPEESVEENGYSETLSKDLKAFRAFMEKNHSETYFKAEYDKSVDDVIDLLDELEQG